VAGYRAPGRVNLIGEHVDYAGGLVLPVALEQAITLRGEPGGRTIRLYSEMHPGTAVVDLDRPDAKQEGWARYVAAVAAELLVAGVPVTGFDGRLSSDLPGGAGLSSSAALEVCLGGGLSHAAGRPVEGMELAQLGQRAEHRAVGVPCGIMDQAVSVLGAEGHALLLDCATLEHRPVALPPSFTLVVIDSGVRRRLEDSAYARRRAELEAALAALPPGAVRVLEPEAALAAAAAAGIDGAALRRLRHVVTELRRVTAFVGELERAGGPGDAALGRLLAEGHASLRDDFEVSTPELDLLVELASDEGAVGARMTGAGFGGAIVALVPVEAAEALGARVAERYGRRTGRQALVLVSGAGAGAGPTRDSAAR
jgi:galactokinase